MLESVICSFNHLLACFVFYFPPEVCCFNNIYTLVLCLQHKSLKGDICLIFECVGTVLHSFKLANCFLLCVYHRIHRHALWIMGEYANSKQDILDVTEEIKKGLGDVSLQNICSPSQ